MIRVALLAAVGVFSLGMTRDDPLAGRVAGPPQDCIDPRNGGPEILEDGRILYRQSGRNWFVTRSASACPSLRPLSTLIIERYGSRLCRNDRFRVTQGAEIIPSAYCRFDAFVPYVKGR